MPDVEAQIRAAQARGDFDDLPGKGKPLKLPEVYDPNWWIKSCVERGASTPRRYDSRWARSRWAVAMPKDTSAVSLSVSLARSSYTPSRST
jgi:Domain of unknown function (DUF1992)